jgi:lactate dehydrogenase-like 2-hydroxyacid dehydrogenase
MKPDLLVLLELSPERLGKLRDAGYTIHDGWNTPDRTAAIRAAGDKVRAVLTSGVTGLKSHEIDMLPKLEIICAIAVGYEGIDVADAQRRGIMVTHGPNTNASSVADHAVMLMLAAARSLPQADHAVRTGQWTKWRMSWPIVAKKKLGILGLGTIGGEIAKRAALGFGMEVAYHNRREVAGSPYRYFASLKDMAAWADFLMIATPGGAATHHLVNKDILDALGSKGFVINIGRGGVIDTPALIAALQEKRIAGAGLDVLETEPNVPPELIPLQNVVLTPHNAGRSPEAMEATVSLVIENLNAFFAGKPVLTPVPKMG